MSLNRRLGCLERTARRSHRSYEEGGEDIIRMRRLNERLKACAREENELYQEYQDSIDAFLGADERAKRRGDDPEKDSEVLETIRAYEDIEAAIMDENNDERK